MVGWVATLGRTLGRSVRGSTLAQYSELGRVAASFLELAQLNPAQRRAVRSLFVEIEKAAYDRVEIDRAFDPGIERIFKISIPHV